jgi:hypothetical protein
MKQFVGKDIREVMVADGPPVHQFDMGDGRRAFQWYIGGGTYVIPQTTTGTVTNVGGQAFVNATTTGGQVVSSEGCLVTYIAVPGEKNGAWIVKDIAFPDRLFC